MPVTCDVNRKSTLLYDKAVEEVGLVDISVQNAGIITIATVEELTEDEWHGSLVREPQIENRQKRWRFYCNIFVTILHTAKNCVFSSVWWVGAVS